MHSYVTAIFMLFITSLSSNALTVDDDPDFLVNVDTLNQDAPQYFGRIFDRKEFEKKGGAFRKLHLSSWLKEKGQYIVFAKTAFILPMNANRLIESQYFKDEQYLRALFPRILSVSNKDTKLMLQVHEFDDVNFLRRKTRNLRTLNQFTVYDPLDNPKQNHELFTSVSHFDQGIQVPLVGVVKFEVLESSEPAIQQAVNISKYYALGSQTLVISYRLALIKPLSWIVKNALEYASSWLLRADREDFTSGAKSAFELMHAKRH